MEDQRLLDILNQTPPKHVWTQADRELLAVAQKVFEISNKELTVLFNHLCRDRLVEEGFTGGLKVTAISSQVADLKRTDRGSDFRQILSMAPTAVQTRHRELITTIYEAAENLGMPIRSYAEQIELSHVSSKRPPTARTDDWASTSDDSEDSHTQVKKQRTMRTPSPMSSLANTGCYLVDTTTPTTNTTVVTPASLASSSFVDSCSPGSYRPQSDSPENDYQFLNDEHFPATSRRIPPLLKINYDNRGGEAAKRPRLLFRACDPEHELVARRFLGPTTSIFPPPPFSSHEFRDMASRHLHTDKTFMSPFLSWAESPERALKLIKKSEVSLSLAIVDFNVIEEHLIQRFGKTATPWLVPHICEKFNFTDLRRIHDDNARATHDYRGNYTGAGEVFTSLKVLRSELNLRQFLTWGSVTCKLVGTLDKEAAMKLLTTMRNMKKISYKAGSVLSQVRRSPFQKGTTDSNSVYRVYAIFTARLWLTNFAGSLISGPASSTATDTNCSFEDCMAKALGICLTTQRVTTRRS